MRVLIAACIRQEPEILREFLESLDGLEKPFEYHYFFITTLEEEAKEVLKGWVGDKHVTIREEEVKEEYIIDDNTHHWTAEHVKTLMRLRDIYLNEARVGEYDYLFSMDADIYFQPKTLVKLLHRKKDIITEIHWTKWYAASTESLPNVWFFDNYGFPPSSIQGLKDEALVKVGGVCGTYLISKKALDTNISFTIEEGVPENWGEDRHFAARAQRLGFDLWCDTTIPSFHIYRGSDLPKLREWKKRWGDIEFKVLDCRWGTKAELENPKFMGVIEELDAIATVFPRWSRRWEYPYAYLNSDLKDEHRVLDAGCGDSPFKFLLEQHCGEVHCIDKEQIDIPENSNIIFKQCDLSNIDYPDNYFDRVFCISVLEHTEHPPIEYIRAMLRVLKIGGTLHLTMDFNRLKNQWRFNADDMLNLLQEMNIEMPPTPKDVLKSEEHPEGRTVGEGLSVMGFTLCKTRQVRKNSYTFPEAEVEKGSVLIGICIGEREIHQGLTVWLLKTFKQHPDWGLEISRMHPIDSNRNAIVKKFMTLREAQKFEYLLFVDTDIVPPLGAVDALLSHGKKVVGGICFIMSPDAMPIPNISIELDEGHYQATLVEVKGMGTGFMLIHRDVLRDVGKSPFRFRYDEWGMVTICGEDYDFCEKAVNAGYKIYADFGIQCGHYKQVDLTMLNKTLSHIITEKNERRPKKPVSDSPSSSSGN